MTLVMYMKPGCPWCEEQRDRFRSQGVEWEEIDAQADPAARAGPDPLHRRDADGADGRGGRARPLSRLRRPRLTRPEPAGLAGAERGYQTRAGIGSSSNGISTDRLVVAPQHGRPVRRGERDDREPVAHDVVVVLREPLAGADEDLDVRVAEPLEYRGRVGHRVDDGVLLVRAHEEARRDHVVVCRRQLGRPAGRQCELELVRGHAVDGLDERRELRRHPAVDLDDRDRCRPDGRRTRC